jgi:hypothetical protein
MKCNFVISSTGLDPFSRQSDSSLMMAVRLQFLTAVDGIDLLIKGMARY